VLRTALFKTGRQDRADTGEHLRAALTAGMLLLSVVDINAHLKRNMLRLLRK